MKMKKYLNKGLIYNWFNSAKVPIIIGLLIWGFIANEIISNEIIQTKSRISDLFSNGFTTTNIDKYFGLGVIFVAIYFIAQGINKRNAAMFLASGPYTKKQIKYNELMCLLITLVFFTLAYSYIALMAYVRNRELLSIIDGYGTIILIEIARIVLIGIIGILFMLTVDLLFSNTVIGFISMIFVIPVSIYVILMKVFEIIDYTRIYSRFVVANSGNSEFQRYTVKVLIERGTMKEIRLRELFFEIVIALFIIVIMFFILNVTQQRYKLEWCNKIFSSKTNENILVILIATAIGSFASLFLLSDFINNIQRRNEGNYLPLAGIDLVKALSVDLLCIVIVGFISYKIIKKVLKALV
jgi:hypothetical protein